jgi:hypothetical protein
MRQLARLLPLVAAVCSGMFGQDADGIHWLSNYQDALKEARATGKPIFLEYRCEP